MTASTNHASADFAPLTVAVLYGGASPEHSVSCVSAGAIMEHLDPAKYTVVPVGISRTGTWYVGTTDLDKLRKHDRTMPEVADEGIEVQLSVSPARRGEIRYLTGDKAGEVYAVVDIIFPVLHGPQGEDGTMQGLFELLRCALCGARCAGILGRHG